MDQSCPSAIVYDAGALPADVGSVDTLAQLQLDAHRHGAVLLLRNAPAELLQLLAFLGLDDVLRVETRGQAEEREQRLGVEEERELDDPAL
jgi:hypothetical protein